MASGIALLDGNSLGFAAQGGTKLTCAGREVQAIFGMVRSLRKIKVESPAFKLLILWDGRSWRKDAFPPYKAKRDDNPKAARERVAYKAQRPDIGKAAMLLGIPQVIAGNLEADDLAGIMTRGARAQGSEVLLVSGDRDWLQLVDESVTWYDPIRKHRVRLEDFQAFTGYATPSAFVEGKCLMGDSGDEIPGVGGIGEKYAPQLLAEYSTVAEFMLKGPYAKKLPAKAKALLNDPEKMELFRRNMMLMDLRVAPPTEDKTYKIINRSFNSEGFRQFCLEHQFDSILTDFSEWTSPFQAI